MNPLLQTGELPAFESIRPEHITPALDVLLIDAEAALERAVGPGVVPDYDTLSLVLDVPVERLMSAWGTVCHLQSTADTPELRAAHAQNLPRIIDFSTRMGADERLYAKYKAVLAAQGNTLTPARRKALDDALRDFVLGGAELQGEARVRYAAIQDRTGSLSQKYGEHVLDATDSFSCIVTEAQMDGVPADACEAARAAAQADGQEGYKLTLQFPSYQPV
ncbi:MAG: oligopeptidase A, partial [Rubrivivax sp.]|nr:oligopeptidase A [Rubrivivax sp.]